MLLLYKPIIVTFISINDENMKTVSFKIKDSIFKETEKLLSQLKKPWDNYINEALDYYNSFQKQSILEKKLNKESDLIKADLLNILEDFDGIDYAH